MLFDLVGPDIAFAAISSVLMVTGVLDVKEGAAGFSNTGVLTILFLQVIAEGISQTGALDAPFRYFLGGRGKNGRPPNAQFAQMRLMVREERRERFGRRFEWRERVERASGERERERGGKLPSLPLQK